MTENLGDILRQHKAEHESYLNREAEKKRLAEEAEAKKNHELCQKYLDDLRIEIPKDIKNRYRWDEKRNGMTFVISSRGRNTRDSDFVPARFVHRSPETEKRAWNDNRFFGTRKMWDEFRAWANEQGLVACLYEEGHSESRGDDGWFEHDYYYIFIKAKP